MAHPTLLSMAAIGTASAFAFLAVGRLLGRRHVDGEARLAHQAFRLWWVSLALSTLLGSVLRDVLVAFGVTSLPLFIAAQYGNIALVCIALAGLLYYLVYVYSGRRGAWKPIVAFYVLYFAFLVSVIVQAHPIGVVAKRFSASLVYETPIAQHPMYPTLILLLVGPQILAALAYFLLVFRVEGTTARYRVSMVSLSILGWFGMTLVAAMTGMNQLPYWPVVSRLLGLTAAFMVFLAYRPPGFVRRSLGVRAVVENG